MKNNLNTRDAKLKFLYGLASGQRSISEIQEQTIKWITFYKYDDQPGFAFRQDTGERLTVAEADKLTEQYKQPHYAGPTVFWIEFKKYASTSENKNIVNDEPNI